MQGSMEEGMTDRKAEDFLEEETETDAGMMEDLEHSVQWRDGNSTGGSRARGSRCWQCN